jgi:predicted glycosyltransferase
VFSPGSKIVAVFRNYLYYRLKPFIPRSVRFFIRRWTARQQWERARDTWPIMPGSEHPPDGWPGWPDGKKCALVLTHDVEGPDGLKKTLKLMQLDKQLGFRSSFNFIPEGSYSVPAALRDELTSNGFEVGVHDLRHDGHLYSSYGEFRRNAVRINHFLKEWNAVGFRSGFMMNKLEWLHELDVRYDASTFDTDPFEPQPQGRHTIFPFRVDGENGSSYVELPYTLPQDSTVFLLLEEKGSDLWKKKLEWIVRHGGMALINVHPDYMAFDAGESAATTFPSALYREFLEYVAKEYRGQYWNALPREVADFVDSSLPGKRIRKNGVSAPAVASTGAKLGTIWIDLDNTPHVPFFEPIIEELSRRGYRVLLTARDAFQVCEMADQKGMRYTKVGRHHGKNAIVKLAGLYLRAMQLRRVVQREKPLLGVSHGSRAQSILCNLLRIPSVIIADYEHARFLPLMGPDWEIVPDVIPDSALDCRTEKVLKYPGIKEDVYVPRFKPDAAIRGQLGLRESQIVVTARPPASEAHYRNPESDVLFSMFMDRALRTPDVRIVLLPRNSKQADLLREQWAAGFEEGRIVIPAHAVDGLNLLWHSDLVVSGGGTMNREAAALGVPVYSVFKGATGAVDRHLAKQGRLILVETREEIASKIVFSRRAKGGQAEISSAPALSCIVDHIERVLASVVLRNRN